MNSTKLYQSASESGFNYGCIVMLDYIENLLSIYEKHDDKISIKELRSLINEYRKPEEN